MSAPICMIPGDRTAPRWPVQPHLRVAGGRVQPAASAPACPLYSRIAGRLVLTGALSVEEAAAAMIAGEG